MLSFVLLYARAPVCSPKENNQIYLKHKITNFVSVGFTVFYSCALLCCALQSAQLWHPLFFDPWTGSGKTKNSIKQMKPEEEPFPVQAHWPDRHAMCTVYQYSMYFIYNMLKRKFLHLILRLWLILNIFCMSLDAFTNLLSQGDWRMFLC